MPSNSRRQRRGSVFGLAGATYVTLLVGFVTGPITARVLGPKGRGEVAAAAVYSGIAVLLLSWGMPNAVAYRASKVPEEAGKLLGSAMRWAAIGTVPAVAASILCVFMLPDFTSAGRLGVAIVVALSPLAVVAACVETMIRSRGELSTLTHARLLAIGIPAIGVVVLALTSRLSVGSAVGVTTLGSLATLVFVLCRFGESARGRYVPLRRLLGYATRSSLGTAAIAVSGRLDQAIIAPLFGSQQLGLYAVAVTVSNIPVGFAAAIASRAWGAVAEAPQAAGADVAAAYVRKAVVVVVVMLVPIGVATPFALPLVFGAEFQGSVAPALLLLPATFAASLYFCGETCLSALGYPGRASLVIAMGTIVGILALALLLVPFGIAGAAVATSLDSAVTALGIAICLRRAGVTRLMPRKADLKDVWQMTARVSRSAIQRVVSSVRTSFGTKETIDQSESME